VEYWRKTCDFEARNVAKEVAFSQEFQPISKLIFIMKIKELGD